MKVRGLFILFLSVSLTFVACEKEAVKSERRTPKASTNVVDRILISFKDGEIRQSDVSSLVEMRLRLELINRKIKPNVLQKFRVRAQREALPFLIQSHLFKAYCATNQISLRPERIIQAQKRVAKQHRVKDFATLTEKLTASERDSLNQQISESLLIDAARSNIISRACLSVSDGEIKKAYGELQHMMDVAQATNRLVYARATNIWQQIVSKKITFEEAAQDYTECEYASGDGAWGAFTRDRLTDEHALLARLDQMNPGDITPPIDSDNGVAIIRLDRIVGKNPEALAFSRVFFRLAETWKLPSTDEMRKLLLRKKQDDAVHSEFEKLMQAAGFVDHLKDDKKVRRGKMGKR